MSTTEARKAFSTVVSKAAFGKERIVLTRQGKDIVAVVSVEDLALLEAIEDRQDYEAAVRADAEAESSGEPNVPWETVKREIALLDAAERRVARATRGGNVKRTARASSRTKARKRRRTAGA